MSNAENLGRFGYTPTRETTAADLSEALADRVLARTDKPAGIDPKGVAGAARLPMTAMPWAVMLEAAAAHGEGAVKYDPHNWRTSGGVEVETYVAACFRHLIAFQLGEDTDPDTGLSHLVKLIASAAVLRDAMLHDCATDNRPPPSPPGLIRKITDAWVALIPKAEAARKPK